jgi:energy-converting hydrogenase Eha subunit A
MPFALPEILQSVVPGLCFVLALLAAKVIYIELKKDAPNTKVIQAGLLFTVCVLIMGLINGYVRVGKDTNSGLLFAVCFLIMALMSAYVDLSNDAKV